MPTPLLMGKHPLASQSFQGVIDAVSQSIGLKDRELRYTAVNQAFSDLVGEEMEQILGKTDFDLFPEDIAEENQTEARRLLDGGEPAEREREIRGPQGSRWWRMTETPLPETDGAVNFTVWTCEDITQVKELQGKLVQFQKLESMGPLAAGIAHEINTPIGIILGYAQLLKEDAEEETDLYQGLTVIENQGKICRKIVSDLLRFSRQTESTWIAVDMNECLEEVVSVVEHIFNSDRIEIHRDFASPLPPVKGDKDKLKQVFLNLLNNARDSIDGEGDIVISTRLDQDNDEILISVTDTGTGIPSEILDRIFEPFFTTKSPGRGTGLGLSVTFGIVQEHEGKMEVQSPPWYPRGIPQGRAAGTAFIVRLPVSVDGRGNENA